MTLLYWHQLFQEHLQTKHSKSAITTFFKHLLAAFFHWEPTVLGLYPERELSPSQGKQLQKALEDLKKDKPLQYIIGHTEFMDLTLRVNPDTLIPRPETEELVGWILEDHGSSALTAADLGTGSGCIALALKHYRPHWELHAVDISKAALAIAEENAKALSLAVHFHKGDLRSSAIALPNCKLIVSNPPYVSFSEKIEMQSNVLDYEPHLALFAPEQKPLYFYEQVFKLALKKLSKGVAIYFEINPLFCDELMEMVVSFGFKNPTIRQDLFGKNRMLRCQL
ncbi:MAG: peptide chain release factor N(5)-glutamine methyltransferase [Flavobacteriaceae bacterium]